ncbi:hypothetical protein [Xanthomonas citri]|uniref:hypothetical protein n=1 Tax=Xanthomonas citri TaxID=346 RepID=UPI0022261CD0|nr:hypothetical protein [Xanthomonas citri]UZA98220.1 hypothetical protein OM946_13610 [Xanthomonas citri pv. fuscans]
MPDQTPTQPTGVPDALVKLEWLRIRSIAHYATARALRERSNDLRQSRRDIDARLLELGESYHATDMRVMQGSGRFTESGPARVQHIARERAKLERQRDGIDAIARVIDEAIEQNKQESGDAAAFHAAADYLKQTLADWGLSPNS